MRSEATSPDAAFSAAVPVGDIPRPVPLPRRIMQASLTRRLAIVAVLCALWQAGAMHVGKPLVFPTLGETAAAWWRSTISGELPARVLLSLELLMMGYGAGMVLAALLTAIGAATRFGGDILSTLTAIFTPLPAIALLPLAFLWLGLGTPSMIFVLAHSVLWPLVLNAHAGFQSVPETLRLTGRNYGLGGIRFIALILVPAAFPAILSGLRIAWAFGWRTLIAAELIFGVSSGAGGLGWFVLQARNELRTANVFAGLLTVIIIGFIVENVIFRGIEARTVRRWGMQR
jgi:NitT/TauT family transport system permease protein